jgi:hypothetical protein
MAWRENKLRAINKPVQQFAYTTGKNTMIINALKKESPWYPHD